MNDEQLKRARAVHRSLTVRLRMVQAKLRTSVIEQDCLGIAGKNIHALMLADSDRVTGFGHHVDQIGAQVFADWFLKDADARTELDRVTVPLHAALVSAADDAIAQHLPPADAWKAMAAAFDTAKGEIAGYAVKMVTAPTCEVQP